MEPLSCNTVAFRAISRKAWVNGVSRAVLPAAFFRRPHPKDEVGISVDVVSAQSCESVLKETFGAASLLVGHVRDIGLDIQVDELPHANIVGAPRGDENPAGAERVASQLAKLARYIPPSA